MIELHRRSSKGRPMSHVHTGHGPENKLDCEGCEDGYWAELGRRNAVGSAQRAMIARINACHRSGNQIDTGTRTLDTASDLYTWIVYGTYPQASTENVEEPK